MRFLVLILLLLYSAPAKAAEYPAGSIGYVYERCRTDLKNSRTEEVFQKTYCGQFIAGFFLGWLGSNWIILPKVQDDEPCKEEMEKAHEFIYGKPKTPEEIQKAEEEEKKSHKLLVMVKWFEGVKALFEQEGRKEDVFSEPVLMSWKYFYSMDEGKIKNFEKDFKFDIHPDLLMDTQDMEMMSNKSEGIWGSVFTIKETYDLCLAGLIKARGSEERFNESICSAGIIGFLSGMLSIKRMELRPPVEGECKATIDEFFAQFDIEKEVCVSEKIKAIDVVSLFIQAADEGFPNNSGEGGQREIEIDWSLPAHPMSIYGFATYYKKTCEWKNLPPFDYNKYRTYNE